MATFSLHQLLLWVQHGISLAGVLIILSGIVLAIYQYLSYLLRGLLVSQGAQINAIRLNLGRILVLGLEFIVAADLIGTTTTPDYYSVGIVASIVLIRTVLSFTLNRELIALSKEQ
jgi:uncharacterized membrane protein